MRRATLALALAAAVVCPGGARAQAPAPKPTPTPFTFQVEVDLVSLTVVVYDKGGRFVRGLGPADIEVTEDGVKQQVSLFREAAGGDERIPLSVVLVLDTSGSMKPNMRFLQEAALNFVYKLEEVDTAMVVSFNESVKGSAEFTGDIDRLERFIDGLQTWGGTSLYDAIHYALNRIRDQSGRKAIVVFSDGEDTTSGLRDDDVVNYARAVEATVYCVGIRGASGSAPKGFLRKVAQETGGEFFFPDNVGDLVNVFNKIAEELHNHYLLAYTPQKPPDSQWREIGVKVNREGAQVRVRKGYFAVPRRR